MTFRHDWTAPKIDNKSNTTTHRTSYSKHANTKKTLSFIRALMYIYIFYINIYF